MFVKYKIKITAFIFFSIISIIFFHKIIFSDYFFFNEDNRDLFYPNKIISAGILKSGEFPLWDKYRFSGTSFLSEIQSQNFYPPYYVFSFAAPEKQIDYLTVLHTVLAGYFMFLLINYLTNNISAGIIAGVFFMFSGPFLQAFKDSNYGIISTVCWIPLILFYFLRMLDTKKYLYSAWFSLAVSMQILAGHLQFVFYTHLMLLLVFIWHIYTTREKVARKIILYTTAGVLSFCLTAIQLLPTLHFSKQTDRAGGVSYKYATGLSLKPDQLITYIFTDFFGDREFNYFGPSTTSYTGYCGAIAVLFAFYYFIYSRKKIKLVVILVSILSIFLALGKFNPLYSIIYKLPVFSIFRAPSRAIIIFSTLIIICSSLGIAKLLNSKKFSIKFFLIPASAILFAALITLFDDFTLSIILKGYKAFYNLGFKSLWLNYFIINGIPSNAIEIMRNSILSFVIPVFSIMLVCAFYASGKIKNPISVSMLILIAGIFNLWFTGFKLLDFSLNKIEAIKILPKTAELIHKLEYDNMLLTKYYANSVQNEFQKKSTPFRINGAYYIKFTWNNINDFEEIHGRTAVLTKDYLEYLGLLDSHSNFEKLLNIKYTIYPQDIKTGDNKIKIFNEESHAENYILYKNTNFLDRFTVVRCPLFFNNKNDIYSFIGTDTFIPEKQIALLDSDRREFEYITSASDSCLTGNTNKFSFLLKNLVLKHNKFSFEISSSKPAILFVSQLYNNDWNCYNNSEPSRIFRANYLFSCIKLNEGVNKIEFKYEPVLFKVGIIFVLIYVFVVSLIFFAQRESKTIEKKYNY